MCRWRWIRAGCWIWTICEKRWRGATALLVSVMRANNETGVLQDVAAIAKEAKAAGAIMHTDAAQALGKVPVDFRLGGGRDDSVGAQGARSQRRGGADCAAGSGLGAAAGGRRTRKTDGARPPKMSPELWGWARRARWRRNRWRRPGRLAAMRDKMEEALTAAGAVIFGREAERLPNTSLFGFPESGRRRHGGDA